MVNGAAHQSMATRLGKESKIAALAGGDELREFLYLGLIREIEEAILRAQPSPKRPLPAGDGWVSVGLNREFVWRVPFREPPWAGHLYVFELTRQPVTRSTRRSAVLKPRCRRSRAWNETKSCVARRAPPEDGAEKFWHCGK
jgi:hypothetical protein